MAFNTKYFIEHRNTQTDQVWRVDIKQDNFVGTPIEFQPGDVPIEIEYQTDIERLDWNIASSICTVTFFTELPSLFDDLQAASDRSFLLEVSVEGAMKWRGWVNPESLQERLYAEGLSELVASDRLEMLESFAYETVDTGLVYTGQGRFPEIMARALAPLGLDMGFRMHSFWFPYNAANPLSENTHDPLWHSTVEQRVWLDDENQPLSCRQVVQDVLMRFKLQLFQADGRWYVMQRRRFQNVAPDGVTSFNYTSAGAKDSPLSSFQFAAYPVGNSINVLKAVPTVFSQPRINQGAILYQHGNINPYFRNSDFEDTGVGIQGWTTIGTGSVSRTSGGFNGGSAVSIETSYQSDLLLSVPETGISQTTSESIDAATGYRIRFRCRVRLPFFGDLRPGQEVVWHYRLQIGDRYYQHGGGSWTTTNVLNRLSLTRLNPSANWYEIDELTGVLDGRSGPITVEVYGAVEQDDSDPSGRTQLSTLLDDVSVELERDGEIISEATYTAVVENDATPGMPREAPTVLIGEGPISTFRGSIMQRDANDDPAGVANDWGFGVVGAGGVDINELWCIETLREARRPATIIEAEILHAGTAINEPQVYQFAGIESPTIDGQFDDYFWFSRLRYRPSMPSRVLDGQWCRVLYDDPGPTTVLNRAAEEGDSPGTAVLRSLIGTINVNTNITSPTVATIADLEARAVGAEINTVYVQQYRVGNSLGGGMFIGIPTDVSTPADQGTVFIGSDGRRWFRADAKAGANWRTEWFGARWDGSTDDGPAIQLLVDAAPHGTHIDLPAARALINTRVNIDGKTLRFFGSSVKDSDDEGGTGYPSPTGGTVFLSAGTFDESQFRVSDTINAAGDANSTFFDGIHFIGNNGAVHANTASDKSAVEFLSVRGAGMVNCTVMRFTRSGVTTTDANVLLDSQKCERLSFSFCQFNNNGSNGLYLQADNSTVSFCTADGNDSDGFTEGLFSLGKNNYTSIVSTNNGGRGLLMSGTAGDARVTNSIFADNGGSGIVIGIGSVTVRSIQITGNQFLRNGTDTTLEPALRSGITVTLCEGVAISGNTSSNNQGYGIAFLDSSKTALSGNTGSGNTLGFLSFEAETITGAVNVLESGVLQGAVDASAQLQSLVASVPAGSVVTMPHGSYQFNSTLVINKALRIIGAGTLDDQLASGSRITAASTLDAPLVQVTARGVVLEGIGFIGHASAPSIQAVGVDIVGVSNVVVSCCRFDGFRGSAIVTNTSSSNCVIDKCFVYEVEQHGIFLRGREHVVSNCFLIEPGQAGIYAFSALDAKIDGVTVYRAGTSGFVLDGAERARIMGCKLLQCDESGILIGDGGENTIWGNSFDSNGRDVLAVSAVRAGVRIQGGAKNFIHGNHFANVGLGAGQQYSVSVGSDIASATVINNETDGNEVLGFWLLDANSAHLVSLDIDVTAESVVFSAAASGRATTASIMVPGARVNDVCTLGAPAALQNDFVAFGKVTANDTLALTLINGGSSSITPTPGDWAIRVSRRQAGEASVPPPPTEGTLIMQHIFGRKNQLKHA